MAAPTRAEIIAEIRRYFNTDFTDADRKRAQDRLRGRIAEYRAAETDRQDVDRQAELDRQAERERQERERQAERDRAKAETERAAARERLAARDARIARDRARAEAERLERERLAARGEERRAAQKARDRARAAVARQTQLERQAVAAARDLETAIEDLGGADPARPDPGNVDRQALDGQAERDRADADRARAAADRQERERQERERQERDRLAEVAAARREYNRAQAEFRERQHDLPPAELAAERERLSGMYGELIDLDRGIAAGSRRAIQRRKAREYRAGIGAHRQRVDEWAAKLTPEARAALESHHMGRYSSAAMNAASAIQSAAAEQAAADYRAALDKWQADTDRMMFEDAGANTQFTASAARIARDRARAADRARDDDILSGDLGGDQTFVRDVGPKLVHVSRFDPPGPAAGDDDVLADMGIAQLPETGEFAAGMPTIGDLPTGGPPPTGPGAADDQSFVADVGPKPLHVTQAELTAAEANRIAQAQAAETAAAIETANADRVAAAERRAAESNAAEQARIDQSAAEIAAANAQRLADAERRAAESNAAEQARIDQSAAALDAANAQRLADAERRAAESNAAEQARIDQSAAEIAAANAQRLADAERRAAESNAAELPIEGPPPSGLAQLGPVASDVGQTASGLYVATVDPLAAPAPVTAQPLAVPPGTRAPDDVRTSTDVLREDIGAPLLAGYHWVGERSGKANLGNLARIGIFGTPGQLLAWSPAAMGSGPRSGSGGQDSRHQSGPVPETDLSALSPDAPSLYEQAGYAIDRNVTNPQARATFGFLKHLVPHYVVDVADLAIPGPPVGRVLGPVASTTRKTVKTVTSKLDHGPLRYSIPENTPQQIAEKFTGLPHTGIRLAVGDAAYKMERAAAEWLSPKFDTFMDAVGLKPVEHVQIPTFNQFLAKEQIARLTGLPGMGDVVFQMEGHKMRMLPSGEVLYVPLEGLPPVQNPIKIRPAEKGIDDLQRFADLDVLGGTRMPYFVGEQPRFGGGGGGISLWERFPRDTGGGGGTPGGGGGTATLAQETAITRAVTPGQTQTPFHLADELLWTPQTPPGFRPGGPAFVPGPGPGETGADRPSEIPDWQRDEMGEPVGEPAPVETPRPIPDWQRDPMGEPVGEPAPVETPVRPARPLPDWQRDPMNEPGPADRPIPDWQRDPMAEPGPQPRRRIGPAEMMPVTVPEITPRIGPAETMPETVPEITRRPGPAEIMPETVPEIDRPGEDDKPEDMPLTVPHIDRPGKDDPAEDMPETPPHIDRPDDGFHWDPVPEMPPHVIEIDRPQEDDPPEDMPQTVPEITRVEEPDDDDATTTKPKDKARRRPLPQPRPQPRPLPRPRATPRPQSRRQRQRLPHLPKLRRRADPDPPPRRPRRPRWPRPPAPPPSDEIRPRRGLHPRVVLWSEGRLRHRVDLVTGAHSVRRQRPTAPSVAGYSRIRPIGRRLDFGRVDTHIDAAGTPRQFLDPAAEILPTGEIVWRGDQHLRPIAIVDTQRRFNDMATKRQNRAGITPRADMQTVPAAGPVPDLAAPPEMPEGPGTLKPPHEQIQPEIPNGSRAESKPASETIVIVAPTERPARRRRRKRPDFDRPAMASRGRGVL